MYDDPFSIQPFEDNKLDQMKLLEGILVIDFSQFLSGPSASLRLADLGARVIKMERPGIGDICRELYVSNVEVDGESTIFHAINRNKESYQVDIKNPEDQQRIKKLMEKADVVIHNFRPGVMGRVGFSYEEVKKINPQIVYACINGYGNEGEWKDYPGQDLLLQSVSGISFLNGNMDDPPTPMGVAVADILVGIHLAQGILAALLNKGFTKEGALVEVSMLESLMDFQADVLTSFYNDGHALPVRSKTNNGHAYLEAPYGIFQTADGFIALAFGKDYSLETLFDILGLPSFKDIMLVPDWFDRKNKVNESIQNRLLTKSTKEWLDIMEPSGILCSEVMDYDKLMDAEGYKALKMEQEVTIGKGFLTTTRCPIRVDGEILKSVKGAPALGEHTASINAEFGLL